MQHFLKRYSRTILLEGGDFSGQEALSKSKILIVGAGGLSSSIISILVSSGVSEIIIWDGDVLDISNLQRQFIYKETDVSKPKVKLVKKFANSLNSSVKITPVQKMLSLETEAEFYKIARNCNIIIDGTDSFSSRVIANKIAISLNLPFFTGSAIGVRGHIYNFAGHEALNPCYSCIFGEDTETFKENITCENSGVLPSTPAIVGSIIAQNVLSYIVLKKINFFKFILIDFSKEKYFKELTIKKDLTCKICSQK